MKYYGYAVYMGLMLLLTCLIFITPFIGKSMPQLFELLHAIYAPACHQLAERSLCYFENGTIGDCAQIGIKVNGRQTTVETNGIVGYKFPVCARDLAIYGAMILGGLLFLFLRKIDCRTAPPFIYFVIAILPAALDGGTQLIGLRESTNELRLITGFIAGIVVPFYIIPILNGIILGPNFKN